MASTLCIPAGLFNEARVEVKAIGGLSFAVDEFFPDLDIYGLDKVVVFDPGILRRLSIVESVAALDYAERLLRLLEPFADGLVRGIDAMGLIRIVSVDFNELRDGAILDGSYFYGEFRAFIEFRVVSHMAMSF